MNRGENMIYKNTTIHIEKIGDVGRPIIFLHGWGQSGDTFKPVLNQLTKPYQVYLVDLPGFGQSGEPETAFTLDDYVELLETMIAHYQITNPLIIGHSFGGRIAIKHASRYHTAGKLLLVNSAGLKDKRKLSYYFRVYTYKFLKKLFSFKLLHRYREKVLGRFGSKDYKNASPVMRQTLVQVVNQDLSEELKQIVIPVLLFWGELDDVTPISHAERMKSLLHDSGLVTVKEGGHFSYLDDPFLFARVLEVFYRSEG